MPLARPPAAQIGGVSNTDARPPIVERRGLQRVSARPERELIAGRLAALGPDTAVRRLLPTLGRRMVGAWCFLDHYGPADVATRPGLRVPPHPHTGLQTVSWLFAGAVHHRDSLGSDVTFGPGQLGLMTAGAAIAHSEQPPIPHPDSLHGTQLWVALPDSVRATAPTWEFHPRVPRILWDAVADVRVVLGEFAGRANPATTFTPIVALDIELFGATELPLEPDFEYAAIAVAGAVVIDDVAVPTGSLLYLGTGRSRLAIAASPTARLMLLGGEPFAEPIVMWWNFVGRNHEEIVGWRTEWEEHRRFGDVAGTDARTPAPALPSLRLAPRGPRR
jgi:redox-sensitive bicupin YhaK (pirin superfamily)